MKATVWVCVLLSIWMLASCSFDQDEAYRPVSEGLAVLSESKLFQLNRGESREMDMGNLPISDITADPNGTVWAASARGFVWKNPFQSNGNGIGTDSLLPHFLATGQRYVLVVDTVKELVGFFDFEAVSLLRSIPVARPGPAANLVDKFYVVSRDSLLVVFQEQSLSLIDSVQIGARVETIRKVQDGSLVLPLRTQPLQAARITYLNDGLTEAPFNRRNLTPGLIPCAWLDQQFPPSVQALYGTEWTAPVALCPDSIRTEGPAFGAGATDIAVDFFQSIAYFRRGDSLFFHDLNTVSETAVIPSWSGGTLQKALPVFQENAE